MPAVAKTRGRDTYLDLVAAFPLRKLRSAGEHARAKRTHLRLSGATDRATRDYLDVLVDLIANYERRAQLTIDTSHVTAAELVRHRMDERALSVSTLARAIGIPQPNLSDMLNGRRDWSKAAIRSLSQFLRIPAERFLV